MDQRTENRLQASIELMKQKLGPGHFIGTDEPKTGNLFSLWKRNAPGTYDPRKGERRDVRIGSIKVSQWFAFDKTSPHPEEIADRMILLMVHGEDTSRVGHRQPIDEKRIDELVQEKVAALLKSQVEKLVQERDRIDTIAKQAANDIIVKDVMAPPKAEKAKKSGIQFKPKKSPAAYAADRESANTLWTERAKILGVEPPVLRPSDKHIDGRWLRRVQPMWDAHVAGQPAATE